MNWFILALRNIFNFKDRARRREYGWFLVGNAVVGIFFNILEAGSVFLGVNEITIIAVIVNLIITILLGIASISVTARRLHDLGYSGWWQCLPLLIIIAIFAMAFITGMLFDSETGNMVISSIWSAIFLIFAFCMLCFYLWLIFKDGQRFENRYGKDPKADLTIKNNEQNTLPNLSEEKTENKIVQKF